MIVLGLHFGHDASVAIIRDGEVLLCVERERLTRVKHALTLTSRDIQSCLSDVDLTVDDVDYCGVTSTQAIEYLFLDRENLSISLGRHEEDRLPSTMWDDLNVSPDAMLDTASGVLESTFQSSNNHYARKMFPADFDFNLLSENFFGTFEWFLESPVWEKRKKLEEISKTSYSPFLSCNKTSYGFHYPAILELCGKKIPTAVIAHHFAHAAYSYYESPFEEAAILTHDGGGHGGYYQCGLYAYGKANKIFPLTPHHLAIGEVYDYSAMRLGFDVLGGAGKLMGLAAYGEPSFFSEDFVGNWYDIDKKTPNDWIQYCENEAERLGYDLTTFGDTSEILSPVNIDFAASCQKLTEEVMLNAVATLKGCLGKSGVLTDNLCLGGGVALNCPANSRIASESGFKDVSILPAVIDSGLSMGSALAVYYNLLEQPRIVRDTSTPSQGYLGLHFSAGMEAIDSALEQFSGLVNTRILDNTAKEVADYLFADKIVALFYGRSEIGPRALGHRSILANPLYKENWRRVNEVKNREVWRPFAPAVMCEHEGEYFSTSVAGSYFMLVNAKVLSGNLPAVTHIDGSARVQSVSGDCGLLYDVIKFFKVLTSVPVVLNTSFNGPGEPVIETPDEALNFLIKGGLDAVFFEGRVVTKKV